MTLDDALGQPGRLVGAWDLGQPSTIAVFATSDAGARELHREPIAPEQRDAASAKVRDRGARLGATRDGHVWVLDDRGIGVWTASASLVEGSSLVIGLKGGGVKPRDIRRVLADNGVRVELATGQQAAITDTSVTPLAEDLAIWLGVPLGANVNADALAIHAVNRAFADTVTGEPAIGNFEHVIHAFGPFGTYGKLQYRYAPNPLDLGKRFLELRLYTVSGKSSWARWISQGTNDDVAAFLRHVRTPYTLLTAMEEMSRKLAQDNYA